MDQKKRILIVDDEPNVRLVLATALGSVGYLVVEAEDGRKALELLGLAGPRFDLALLDLQMPRMDGMELLSRLREAGIAVPVVILTAHGSIPEAVAAMKHGAIDFLTKPITPEALRRVVAEVIARTKPRCLNCVRRSRARNPRIARSKWHSIWPGPSGHSIDASSPRPRPSCKRSWTMIQLPSKGRRSWNGCGSSSKRNLRDRTGFCVTGFRAETPEESEE